MLKYLIVSDLRKSRRYLLLPLSRSRMSDLPGKIRTTSLHLSRILAEAGVSERVVKKTQQTVLKYEKSLALGGHLKGDNITSYLFGSYMEGTYTLELNPDVDQIKCFDDVNVIQEKEEYGLGKINLLVHQGGGIPAGHCRLELLPGDITSENYDLIVMLTCNLCRIDDRWYVKNTVFDWLKEGPGIVVHGPAITLSVNNGNQSGDTVYSFKCNSTSEQMVPRIECLKSKTWPTPDLLAMSEIRGFFVVAVGHCLSEEEDRTLEWRVSPSLTERNLMFGMNITQIQCYVILKIIKHDLISPIVGDAISSFHLKTTLFHCVEITPNDFWKEDNLLLCVNLCIYLLMNFIKNKCCPNYLIQHGNLFLGKIKDEQYASLTCLFAEIMASNGEYLLDIQCNKLGHKLRERHRMHDGKIIKTIDDIMLTELPFMLAHEHTGLNMPETIVSYVSEPQKHKNVSSFVNWTQKLIYKLLDLQKSSDLDIVSDATAMLPVLHTTFGSLIGSWCIRAGIRVSKGAISFLEQGYDSDLSSGRLKHASVLFCSKNFDEAAQILECLLQNWDVLCVVSSCLCYTREIPTKQYVPPAFCERVLECKTESEKRNLLAYDVKFTIHEVFCCPQALRFELFRDVGDDRKLRGPYKDGWMDYAVVDSLIFLYFLLYMTYGKLGKRRLQMWALFNIITQCDKELSHGETAYNLLGQCYEMEQMFDDALRCYRLSLQIRRRNNAAMWLVTLLVYKHFCRGMLAIMRCMAVISRS